jgi:hypothetical protein
VLQSVHAFHEVNANPILALLKALHSSRKIVLALL